MFEDRKNQKKSEFKILRKLVLLYSVMSAFPEIILYSHMHMTESHPNHPKTTSRPSVDKPVKTIVTIEMFDMKKEDTTNIKDNKR